VARISVGSRYPAEGCGVVFTPQADHHQTTVLKEYIKVNTPVLDGILKISSDSACLSDTALSWFEIKELFAKLNSSEIRCISNMPSQDVETLQARAAKRVDDGLQDVLCLALFLDPSMRALVTRTGLLGSAADMSLGATDCVAAAVQPIKAIAAGITVAKRSSAEVGMALSKALQIFLGVRTREDRAAHCKAKQCIAANADASMYSLLIDRWVGS
jgi:hypothetical protein